MLGQHFLHHTAWPLKLSILDQVQGPNGTLVLIPIMFSEISGHDELQNRECSEERIQILVHIDLLRARTSICIRVRSVRGLRHSDTATQPQHDWLMPESFQVHALDCSLAVPKICDGAAMSTCT